MVTGPLAKETNYMVSRYGPQELENITVYDGIEDYAGNEISLSYAKGCEVIDKIGRKVRLFIIRLLIRKKKK